MPGGSASKAKTNSPLSRTLDQNTSRCGSCPGLSLGHRKILQGFKGKEKPRCLWRPTARRKIRRVLLISGAGGAMPFLRIGLSGSFGEFLDRGHGLRNRQLLLRWLRSAADRIRKHFQRNVGVRANEDGGRQQIAAHPGLTCLGQTVAAGERYREPSFALAFCDFRECLS